MQKRSWIVLGICIVLSMSLGFAYVLTRPEPETLTAEQANQILQGMQEAVVRKSVNGVMAYITPDSDAKIANLKTGQLRLLFAEAFRNSGQLRAECKNIAFKPSAPDTNLEFDLVIKQETANMQSEDYSGHITLHMRRVDVPRLFGLFHAKEWRIVGAETTGKDPSTFGNFGDL